MLKLQLHRNHPNITVSQGLTVTVQRLEFNNQQVSSISITRAKYINQNNRVDQPQTSSSSNHNNQTLAGTIFVRHNVTSHNHLISIYQNYFLSTQNHYQNHFPTALYHITSWNHCSST